MAGIVPEIRLIRPPLPPGALTARRGPEPPPRPGGMPRWPWPPTPPDGRPVV